LWAWAKVKRDFKIIKRYKYANKVERSWLSARTEDKYFGNCTGVLSCRGKSLGITQIAPSKSNGKILTSWELRNKSLTGLIES